MFRISIRFCDFSFSMSSSSTCGRLMFTFARALYRSTTGPLGHPVSTCNTLCVVLWSALLALSFVTCRVSRSRHEARSERERGSDAPAGARVGKELLAIYLIVHLEVMIICVENGTTRFACRAWHVCY